MGCLESSQIPESEVILARNIGRQTTIFATKDFVSAEEDVKLDEKALCDETHEGVILITTKKNDIRSLNKIEIIETATKVSKSAIEKLQQRKIDEKRSTRIIVDKEKLAKKLSRQIKQA